MHLKKTGEVKQMSVTEARTGPSPSGVKDRGLIVNDFSITAATVNGSGSQTANNFFKPEDGIRDVAVTGVQTCALPISCRQQRSDGRAACLHARSRRYSASAP